jgi:hypothetical protein
MVEIVESHMVRDDEFSAFKRDLKKSGGEIVSSAPVSEHGDPFFHVRVRWS